MKWSLPPQSTFLNRTSRTLKQSANSRLECAKGGTMKIGFIGLGIMGSRMAANMQKAGYSLVVYNRTREKAEDLVAGGATWADSPAALAAQVEIVFTMLASPAAVRDAALGKD